jgi:branched-chain amino acid transport system permease protein
VAVALRAGGDFTGGALGLFSIPVLVSTTGAIVVAIVAAVGLTFLERGRMGRAIETMREDTHVASAVGIPVERFRLGLLTVSGVLAALSGGMYALMFNAVSPDIGGFPLIVSLLSMVVIGGLASWRGAYLGAAILTWLPDAVTSFDAWSEAAYGAILIAVVILAPGGLLGIAEQVIAPIRGRLARKPELVG